MADDPMTLAFEKSGGVAALVKWIKASGPNRGTFYSLFLAKRNTPQIVNTNTNVNVNNVKVSDRDGEAARRKLEDAFIRLIQARKDSVGDPAVYVNGERVYDNLTIDHRPATDDARRETVDDASGSNSAELKSPIQGPLSTRHLAATTPGAPKKNQDVIQNQRMVPGLYAAAVLGEGADDNLSASEKSLLCFGGRRWP